MLILLFFLEFFFLIGDGSKILVIPAVDSGSHLMSMSQVLNRLSSNGHQLHVMDFFGSDPQKYSKNFHFINFKIPDAPNFNKTEDRRVRWLKNYNTHKFQLNYKEADDDFEVVIELHQERLDAIINAKWDLVIADNIFSSHAYALVDRLKKEHRVPYLFFSPSGQIAAHICEEIALSRNPVQKSVMFPSPPANSKEFFRPTSFYYRLYSFAHVFYEVFGFHWIVAPYYMPNIKNFGVEDFSWQNLYKGAALTFSDSLDRLGWPTSEGTDFVNTGSYCKRTEVLEGELKTFVEDPQSNGTIYIALGTYANWQYAPDHVLRAFSNGLQHFSQYRVIMSYNGDMEKMPKQSFIKLVKWAPQTAILNHPKTRVFVSHGGMKSIKESLCSKTPLILMPMGAEQGHNAHMFLSLDYGRVLNKFTVTEEQVYSEINELLQNPRFQQKSNKLHDIMLDRPIPALDLALFYTERVIRAPNNEIAFKRKGIDLYWHEYLYSQLILGVLSMILLLK